MCRRNANWLLPGYKKVKCKPVADIDFTSANIIYQNMKKEATKSGAHKNNPPRKTTRKPTDDEISAYYENFVNAVKSQLFCLLSQVTLKVLNLLF